MCAASKNLIVRLEKKIDSKWIYICLLFYTNGVKFSKNITY